MNNFKNFNIKPIVNNFTGDKIKIDRVLNVEITIHNFKIEDSTAKRGTKYLTLQIEKNDVKHVIFTGSTILMQMISNIPKNGLPFKTTISKKNEYYEFT